ncbi:MAG: MOSC domain-containing protein [Jatrophihabitantaceae bacterium]
MPEQRRTLEATAADGPVGTVTELWRYPVKSMAGERLERAMVRPGIGIHGDRCNAVEDLGTGKLLSAKTVPAMLTARARIEPADGRVVIELPDGTQHDAAACDAALSEWLDRPVRLRACDDGSVWHFDRAIEPIPGSAVESMSTQPGSFFDTKSPIHLLTLQSIASCQTLVPHAVLDPRRFRPNLLVDAPGTEYPEDDWIDATLRLGEALLWVRREATRCVIPAREHLGGLPADPRIFYAIAQSRGNALGIRLNPTRSGMVYVGQPVMVQDHDGPPAEFAHLRR